MTYEEFEALALNPPRRDVEAIFQVVEYAIDTALGCKKPRYPKFDLTHFTIGFCHTVEEAEALISGAVKDADNSYDEPYCFYVKEYPVGEYIGPEWDGYALSVRLYDAGGKMLDRTYCSALNRDFRTPYGVFRGRPKEAFRFKEGDIVEVRTEDKVRLAVVALANMTIKRCWEIRNRWEKRNHEASDGDISALVNHLEEDYPVDAGDDQSPVIDGPSYDTHEHIHTLNIMPLRFHLSEKMRKKYEGYYQSMLEEGNW